MVFYASEDSIIKLNPDILGHIPSPNDPSTLWYVRTVRDICQEHLGKELQRADSSPIPHAETSMDVEATQSMDTQCNSRSSRSGVPPSSAHSTVYSPLSLGDDVINPQVSRE